MIFGHFWSLFDLNSVKNTKKELGHTFSGIQECHREDQTPTIVSKPQSLDPRPIVCGTLEVEEGKGPSHDA